MAEIYDFASLRPTNPMRPPEWRWRRACALAPLKTPVRFEDNYIYEAIKFINAEKSGVSSARLSATFPVLYEVYRIYVNTDNVRHTIEALILSDTPQNEIMARFGWTEEAGQKIVEYYEALFFDVRARLAFDGFIRAYVLGGSLVSGSVTDDRILKGLGYLGYKRKLGSALVNCYLDLDLLDSESRKAIEGIIESQFTKKTLRAVMRGDPLKSPILLDAIRTHNENRRIALEQRIKGIESGTDGEKRQSELLEALQITAASISDVVQSAIEPQVNQKVDANVEKLLEHQINDEIKKATKAIPDTIDTSARPL